MMSSLRHCYTQLHNKRVINHQYSVLNSWYRVDTQSYWNLNPCMIPDTREHQITIMEEEMEHRFPTLD